jgi:hypothetical protein
LEQDVEAKKASLEQMQKRKETNDVSRLSFGDATRVAELDTLQALRDQKIAQLHTHNGTGGTTASDPAAQNVNVPVAQSPATTVGPSVA